MEDLILTKATEFTNTEVVTLGAWLAAAEAGEFGLARDLLFAGLLAEHYRSLLSEDPAQITEAQSTQLRELLAELDRLLHKLGSLGKGPYGGTP